MTNDALIDVFVMGLNSAEITIVEFQLRSVGDMGDQLAIRLRSMRSSNDLCALRTDCHGSVCKGVHRRRSWRSWRSVRDQSDPLAFWKILALYMALCEWGYKDQQSGQHSMILQPARAFSTLFFHILTTLDNRKQHDLKVDTPLSFWLSRNHIVYQRRQKS